MNNKYSIILGNLGNTCDRFCKGYKSNPTSEEMLEMAVKKIPFIEGIELVGTWDIRPDNVREMKKRLNDYGVACSSIIPDTFTDPDYAKGSITSIVPAIRQKAIDYLRQMPLYTPAALIKIQRNNLNCLNSTYYEIFETLSHCYAA